MGPLGRIVAKECSFPRAGYPRSREAQAVPAFELMAPQPAILSPIRVRSRESAKFQGRASGVAYGFPNVATRSIRHSNSTRFSSISGSRNA